MLKTVLRIVALFLTIFLGVLFCVFLCLSVVSNGKTDAFTDLGGKPLANSVADVRYVNINGVEQYMLIRGRHVEDPILLILHGGPGSPEAALLHKYNAVLEDHFIVVNWDQRGSGASYNNKIKPQDININTMLEDSKEVVEYLKTEFSKEKIFILGHSWGSLLGTCYIEKYPQDVIAYVGLGQIGNIWDSELESYRFVLKIAEDTGNRKAIRELESIGKPEKGLYKSGTQATIKERSWVNEFGGTAYKTNSKGLAKYYKSVLSWQEYRLKDKLNYMKGSVLTFNSLWEEIMTYNLHNKILSVDVPFIVMQGKHDYQTSYSAARAYYEEIHAPYKAFYTFEESAHYIPFNTEAEKFNDLMIHSVRPLAGE